MTAIVLFLGGCARLEPAPVARFEYEQQSANRNGANYVFRNTSTNAARYSWDFGDGSSSIEANPLHTFKKNGNYSVSLIAENGSGARDTFRQTITVNTVPTTGNTVFWSMVGDRGNIEVYINGTLRGTNTKFRTVNSAPECFAEGFTTVTLPEGAYSFTANSGGLVPLRWSGTINVVNGECRSMQLTR